MEESCMQTWAHIHRRNWSLRCFLLKYLTSRFSAPQTGTSRKHHTSSFLLMKTPAATTESNHEYLLFVQRTYWACFESALIYMHRHKAGMCRALYFLLGKGRLLLGPSGAVSWLNKPRLLSFCSRGKRSSPQPSWWPSDEFVPVSQCLCCTGGRRESQSWMQYSRCGPMSAK